MRRLPRGGPPSWQQSNTCLQSDVSAWANGADLVAGLSVGDRRAPLPTGEWHVNGTAILKPVRQPPWAWLRSVRRSDAADPGRGLTPV